jgi:GlpG protein
LFGFVWIRSRLVPRSGFLMPRDMVVWMLIWLLVCTSGLIGPIANVAHGVGLLVGMICGAAPRLWMKRSA